MGRSLCAALLAAVMTACGAPERAAVGSAAAAGATALVVDVLEVERAVPEARGHAATAAVEEADPRWTAIPEAASDATALADQLVAAERAIRDPAVTGRRLAHMGHLQQLVYRQLIERPELRDPVFDAIPAELRAAADLTFAASADLWLFGQVGYVPLPEWRIVDPAPADTLMGHYREGEARFGVPWQYLAAINLVETRMGRIRGESYAGAQGPMQFMPPTWAHYGEGDVNDPRDAILGAARYLRAVGAPDDMERAIWWYNHDLEYVDAVMKYAAVMRDDPLAYRGYYHWQVYFQTEGRALLLPVGWSRD